MTVKPSIQTVTMMKNIISINHSVLNFNPSLTVFKVVLVIRGIPHTSVVLGAAAACMGKMHA